MFFTLVALGFGVFLVGILGFFLRCFVVVVCVLFFYTSAWTTSVVLRSDIRLKVLHYNNNSFCALLQIMLGLTQLLIPFQFSLPGAFELRLLKCKGFLLTPFFVLTDVSISECCWWPSNICSIDLLTLCKSYNEQNNGKNGKEMTELKPLVCSYQCTCHMSSKGTSLVTA